ncbi:unnamed protein product, partial [Pylaiella littoralis]
LRLKLDGVLDVMRDADGRYTWFTMCTHLGVAIRMATDLNLLDARKVLSDAVARGNRMVAACNDPVLVLGVFSKMLPSVHGVSQEVYEADCADLRKVTALSRNFFTNPSGAGEEAAAVAGAARGKLAAQAANTQLRSRPSRARYTGTRFPRRHPERRRTGHAHRVQGDTRKVITARSSPAPA